jgi:hypothetical protein
MREICQNVGHELFDSVTRPKCPVIVDSERKPATPRVSAEAPVEK